MCGASSQTPPTAAITSPITTSVHAGCCIGHFFLGFFDWTFACCIFFRRWANLVAGLRAVWRWFFDMAVALPSNSTGRWLRTVE
jgi:hypothetical protein